MMCETQRKAKKNKKKKKLSIFDGQRGGGSTMAECRRLRYEKKWFLGIYLIKHFIFFSKGTAAEHDDGNKTRR